jgi:hypothetical protein
MRIKHSGRVQEPHKHHPAVLDTRIGSSDPEIQNLKHAEIDRRYERQRKRRRNRDPFNYNEQRVQKLERLAHHRYGSTLPETDVGRNFVFAIAVHMIDAKTDRIDVTRVRQLIDELAPWYDEDDTDRLIARIARKHYRLKGEKLAALLKITFEEMQTCDLFDVMGVTTATAPPEVVAEVLAQRRERKRFRDRNWQAKRRRATGALPREQSAERRKPWKLLGISRRTYYRRRGTNSSTCILSGGVRRGNSATCTPRKPLGPWVGVPGGHLSAAFMRVAASASLAAMELSRSIGRM